MTLNPSDLQLNLQRQTKTVAFEQSVPDFDVSIPLDVQQQIALGGVAISTIASLAFLIREVRLLVKAFKG